MWSSKTALIDPRGWPAPGASIAAWQVPEHRVVSYAPMNKRYCLCLFVINEGRKLLDQLDRMKEIAPTVDIIIADGGSTDGSTSDGVLAKRGVNTLLVKIGPGRLSAQMRMALAFAMRRGYEGVVVMDGNNKDDPNDLPRFVRALDDGFDHIQGSRFIAGGRAIRTPWLRWLGVRLLHSPLLSLAAGFRYTDTTNGFRAYSRRLLLASEVAPFREVFSAYELHYYLAIRAARLAYAVVEVPVTRAYPIGKVPTKIKGLRGNWVILKTLMRACMHAYDPPSTSEPGA
jgi:glycosyltransferase involved in cell wall biosynthesis